MSYKIQETGMVNYIQAARELEALLDSLIRIDKPFTKEFVARSGYELRMFLAKEIGTNVLKQMETQDLERAKADEGAKP